MNGPQSSSSPPWFQKTIPLGCCGQQLIKKERCEMRGFQTQNIHHTHTRTFSLSPWRCFEETKLPDWLELYTTQLCCLGSCYYTAHSHPQRVLTLCVQMGRSQSAVLRLNITSLYYMLTWSAVLCLKMTTFNITPSDYVVPWKITTFNITPPLSGYGSTLKMEEVLDLHKLIYTIGIQDDSSPDLRSCLHPNSR